MNEWVGLDFDEVFSAVLCVRVCVVVVVNDLKALLGISEHVRVGLLLVRLSSWCEDCETFLAASWVNLESHCCCDETVIFFVKHVIHFEWTTVLDISVASQFNSVDFMAECEGSVLKGNTSSEFTV